MTDDMCEKIKDAARDRDQHKLHYMARYERHEYENYVRHESRSELTPSERKMAEEIGRAEGLWL